MSKRNRSLMKVAIALAVVYYILPLFSLSASDYTQATFAVISLLFFMPATAFVASYLHVLWNGFGLDATAVAAVMFIPSIFIFYNSSAWIYVLIFAVSALGGSGLGTIVRQTRKGYLAAR